ncbi:MAG: NAD(P)-dependent glycerol-3-phosphate dehydrogenase [Elusimicrobia bacterium]|nr:NAD(P)-dependent glycerol-3-phosphate dehydrogenase [Elusimicrobiota bacterium]
MTHPIAVLGGGIWGSVLARHLFRKGRQVHLWEFLPEKAQFLQENRTLEHLPELDLPKEIRVTSNLQEALKQAQGLLVALPSEFIRTTLRHISEIPDAKALEWVLSVSKGLEAETFQTPCEITEQILPHLRGRIFAFSGPSFAKEVLRGVPTRIILAGPKSPNRLLEKIRVLLQGPPLFIECSSDRKGVELGGALKNAVALGCGICDGLGYGANAKAALLVQGLAEIAALGKKLGADPETFYGLSGLGDLVATSAAPYSRNRTLGEKLGLGKTLPEALSEIPTVTEGIRAVACAFQLAQRLKLPTPLIESIYLIAQGRLPPAQLINQLRWNGTA